MNEKPILFSAPMVRVIQEGRKTQTRRLVNARWRERLGLDRATLARYFPEETAYGRRGDRLWVKETFFDARPFKAQPLFAAMELDYIYRADYDYREGQRRPSVIGDHHWKPSIFMPRTASRLTLEVVGVRVERLQDINEADALAEGCAIDKGNAYHVAGFEGVFAHATAKGCYETLWGEINGAGSWEQNPWVWVITFRRLHP